MERDPGKNKTGMAPEIWKEKSLDFLRANWTNRKDYPTQTAFLKGLKATFFPKRSTMNITTAKIRAENMGLGPWVAADPKGRPEISVCWTEEQIQWLRDNWDLPKYPNQKAFADEFFRRFAEDKNPPKVISATQLCNILVNKMKLPRWTQRRNKNDYADAWNGSGNNNGGTTARPTAVPASQPLEGAGEGVPLAELGEQQCRFLVDDEKLLYCGRQVRRKPNGRLDSYCDAHAKIMRGG